MAHRSMICTPSSYPVLSLPSFLRSSLQIFHTERHPSAFKSSGAKEGLSLFRLVSKTKVWMGARQQQLSTHRRVLNFVSVQTRAR